MPEDDIEEMSRLIAEAKRLAEARNWATVSYLLDLIAAEVAKTKDMSVETISPPERPKSSAGRRRR